MATPGSDHEVEQRPAPTPAPDHEREPLQHPVKGGSVVDALNYAFEGIIHVLRTQRNMRVHFALAGAVLLLGVALGVARVELMALTLAICLVLVTEMINTAIEAAIDLATRAYDPLAKIAKDVAAGAVLVSAVGAIIVGYLVFAERLTDPSGRMIVRVRNSPPHLTLIVLALVILVVIAVKAISGRGTPMRGGMPSGHAAVAFAGWAAITFVTADTQYHVLVSSLAFLMALLVSQTRVEAGVHSVIEVVYGGVLGALITLIIFQLSV